MVASFCSDFMKSEMVPAKKHQTKIVENEKVDVSDSND